MGNPLGWTSNFAEFRGRIEQIFGPLNELESSHPDMYVEHVMAYGFLEYSAAIHPERRIKGEIAGDELRFDTVLAGPVTCEEPLHKCSVILKLVNMPRITVVLTSRIPHIIPPSKDRWNPQI